MIKGEIDTEEGEWIYSCNFDDLLINIRQLMHYI